MSMFFVSNPTQVVCGVTVHKDLWNFTFPHRGMVEVGVEVGAGTQLADCTAILVYTKPWSCQGSGAISLSKDWRRGDEIQRASTTYGICWILSLSTACTNT